MGKIIFFMIAAVSVFMVVTLEIGLYDLIWTVQDEAVQWIILLFMFTVPLWFMVPLSEMAAILWPEYFED